MPIIQFNLMEGRTHEQKRELARRVADTVVEVLGVKREAVRILIHEMGPYDFSVAGVVAADNGKGIVPTAVNGHAATDIKA